MMEGDLSDLQPLSPHHFFQFQVPCKRLPKTKQFPVLAQLSDAEREPFLLPNLGAIGGEVHFASIWMGWQPEGIEFFVRTKVPYQKVTYPSIANGDSFEAFIDTRDLKNVGSITRFCHHFYFLPEAIEGHQKAEITHFRGDEKHDLCDTDQLILKAQPTKQGYELGIRIPAECLHGYDPEQIERIGFTYRLNRASGTPQFFTVSSEEFAFEQLPTLWGSMKLEGR